MERGIPATESDLYRCFMAWVTTGLKHEAIRLGKRRQRRCGREVLILDSPVRDASDPEGSCRAIDLIAAPNDTESEAIERVTLETILSILTPTQRKIIELLTQGLTERMVARSLGISQPAVNKMKWAALRRIKLNFTRGR